MVWLHRTCAILLYLLVCQGQVFLLAVFVLQVVSLAVAVIAAHRSSVPLLVVAPEDSDCLAHKLSHLRFIHLFCKSKLPTATFSSTQHNKTQPPTTLTLA